MPDTVQHFIVNQARTWLGTPFHHQAWLKLVGCDCLGLIIGVLDELGLRDKHGQLLADYDEVSYLGDEAQLPDTFISSFYPAGQILAYVVIKDFPLASYSFVIRTS